MINFLLGIIVGMMGSIVIILVFKISEEKEWNENIRGIQRELHRWKGLILEREKDDKYFSKKEEDAPQMTEKDEERLDDMIDGQIKERRMDEIEENKHK